MSGAEWSEAGAADGGRPAAGVAADGGVTLGRTTAENMTDDASCRRAMRCGAAADGAADGDLSLRRCGEADVAALCAIGAETFRDTFADTSAADDMAAYLRDAYAGPVILAELRTAGSEFYLAYRGDEPAGFLKLNFGAAQNEDMGPGMMEIERLYVRVGHKRHGVGGMMMRFALDRGRAEGCRGAWLGVWEHNEPAKAFYARMGFAFVGSHVFTVGSDDQTDLLMARMY